MSYLYLYRIAAALAALGLLGHTLGGMLGTAKRGVSVPEADALMAKMRSVHFLWRGGDSSWFNWWMGNGLGVSALMLPAIVALWVLGGLTPEQAGPFMPVAWALFAAFAGLSWLGFKYFVFRIGVVFGLITALAGLATVLASL